MWRIRLGLRGNLRVAFFRGPCRGVGGMKALQATCIVGAIALTGMIHQVGGNAPGATVPDATPEAAVSAATPGAPALSAAVPEAAAGPETLGACSGESLPPTRSAVDAGSPPRPCANQRAELGSVPGAVSGPSLMAKAEI